ncbi:MAG: hypothetical protein L0332_02495 [Chloroflexi bacterium]|nr:hypothetical protein [Chloroflexota bacterium]MCI0579845.1 hypothetical protein [Chloroflexota bacterium]MCI0645670.1 hypothetical protein [Chloroflexota bacterium]MCI0725582.1 hypothetical protein [Chloroflexota bacterium]
MLRQEDLQELVAFNGQGAKIISLYLDADTGTQTNELIKQQARALLREAEEYPDDVKAIEDYLDYAHDWSRPGLAIFCCTGQKFFRVYSAAVAFRNRIRIGNKPYVKPLTHLMDHYAHFGVIVVDRVGARFFEYHLGELQESAGTMGEDVRKLKRGGGSSRGGGTSSATGKRGGQGGRHEEEVVHRNLREVAAAAQSFFSGKPIRRLFLGGTVETAAQLRDLLPKQLQSCLAGTFPMEMTAGEHEVRQRSLELLQEANNEREKRLVEQMITTAAKGGNAVTGLEDTLRAVAEGRVQNLIISDGFHAPGYLHQETAMLMAGEVGGLYNDGKLQQLDDVVEAAVARTIEQGGHVEIVSDNPELERVGRIGALLRY